MARVTRSVSSRREPGGNSTASSARDRSSDGIKPEGSSRVDQIEPAKISAPQKQRDPAPAHGAAHQRGIGAHDPAVLMLGMARRGHEIGRHDRRDEPRNEQRDHHRHRDRQAELAKILPRNAAHKTDGREDRGNRQRNRDHREADLVRRLQRRLIGRFAHAHVAHDVLDLDDRVVDQNARHQRDREQAHQIEREPERAHRPESRDDGQGQRQRRGR